MDHGIGIVIILNFAENFHEYYHLYIGMIKILPVCTVIPCFNCSKTIRRAVTSILEQSCLPSEIIIIDDASTDNSKNVIEALCLNNTVKIRYVKLKNNSGPATARNVGWSLNSYEYISFLDADDTWQPEKLEIQYGIMTANPNLSLLGHGCTRFDKNEEFLRDYNLINWKKISKWKLLISNRFSTPTVMMRSDILCRFHEGAYYAEDFMLWLDMVFEGYNLGYINLPLANIHKSAYGDAGLSNGMWDMELGELSVYKNLFSKKHINVFIWMAISVYSYIKYLRRIVMMKTEKC